LLSFLPGCSTGRNKPDLIVPQRVDDYQNSAKCINTDRDEPFLVKPIVWDGNCQIV
jgi:hypothetical protein